MDRSQYDVLPDDGTINTQPMSASAPPVAKRWRKRAIVVNVILGLGVLALVGAITSVTAAYGWYAIGPEMRHHWRWGNCTVRQQVVEIVYDQYQRKYRLVCEVDFVSEDWVSHENAALTSFSSSWSSNENTIIEQAKLYNNGTTHRCFSPKHANDFFDPSHWDPSKFTILGFTEAALHHLEYWFSVWFWVAIGGFVATPVLVGVPAWILFRTRCWRKRYRRFF